MVFDMFAISDMTNFESTGLVSWGTWTYLWVVYIVSNNDIGIRVAIYKDKKKLLLRLSGPNLLLWQPPFRKY
jgi:hypothetical protein